MKIRNGFVSNSSSSSFTITNADHPAMHFLIAMEVVGDYIVWIHHGEVEDTNDNGTWNMIWKYNELTDQDVDYTEFLRQTNFNG